MKSRPITTVSALLYSAAQYKIVGQGVSGYVPFNAIAGNFTRIRVRQTGGRRGLGHEACHHLILNSRPLIGQWSPTAHYNINPIMCSFLINSRRLVNNSILYILSNKGQLVVNARHCWLGNMRSIWVDGSCEQIQVQQVHNRGGLGLDVGPYGSHFPRRVMMTFLDKYLEWEAFTDRNLFGRSSLVSWLVPAPPAASA